MEIYFSSPNRIEWIQTVSKSARLTDMEIIIRLSDEIWPDDLYPFHIVSLACMIQSSKERGSSVSIRNNRIGRYIYNELNFGHYFKDDAGYIPASQETIFNLWRIKQDQMDTFGFLVTNYFRQSFFKEKDLSGVKLSLTEAFYNIFDHADAKGNAFSMLKYDDRLKRLNVAVCDFGCGIPQNVRKIVKVESDKEALGYAIKELWTTQSTTHNRGMGLSNIRNSCTEKDFFGIVSGRGVLVANKYGEKKFDLDDCFPGTLIYYDLTLSNFEDEEIIDSFAF